MARTNDADLRRAISAIGTAANRTRKPCPKYAPDEMPDFWPANLKAAWKRRRDAVAAYDKAAAAVQRQYDREAASIRSKVAAAEVMLTTMSMAYDANAIKREAEKFIASLAKYTVVGTGE